MIIIFPLLLTILYYQHINSHLLSHGLLQSVLVSLVHFFEATEGCHVVPVLDAGGVAVVVVGVGFHVGVVLLGLDAAVFLHVIEGVSRKSADFASLQHTIITERFLVATEFPHSCIVRFVVDRALQQLLLGQGHELAAAEDLVRTLDGARGGEGPAAAALALVLHSGHLDVGGFSGYIRGIYSVV